MVPTIRNALLRRHDRHRDGLASESARPHGPARPNVWARAREDVETAFRRDPSLGSLPEALLHPTLPSIWLHRIAHRLYLCGHPISARILNNVGRLVTGADIHPGATIGRRLFIDHANGVVVGETAVIGDDVTLYQQVTIGAVGWWKDNERAPGEARHPRLGDRVIVGAKASVLGPVIIADDTIVPAHRVIVDSGRGRRDHLDGQRDGLLGNGVAPAGPASSTVAGGRESTMPGPGE